LALAGAHLGDLAVVQRQATDELHVEVAHAQGAAGGLAHHREGFDRQVIEPGARGQPLAELHRLGAEGLVGEGFQILLELAGLDSPGTIAAHDAFAAAAKNTRQILEHWPLEPRNFGNRNKMTPRTGDSTPRTRRNSNFTIVVRPSPARNVVFLWIDEFQ